MTTHYVTNLVYLPSSFIFKLYQEYNEFVIFETLKVDKDNHTTLIFVSPITKLVLYEKENIIKFFDKIEEFIKKGYYLAGFFSYELGYYLDFKGEPKHTDFPLAFFYVFNQPFLIFDHITKSVFVSKNNFDLHKQMFFEHKIEKNFCIKNVKLNIEKEEYVKNIEKIKEYIYNGDTYQINYTIKTKFDISGSTITLYDKLRETQKVPYAAFVKTKEFEVLSFSPELFFRKIGSNMVMEPMKGTISRGRNIKEDKIQAKKLYTSLKNRAENVMIVDLIRNDLGKISSYGDVEVKKLFEIKKYETLFQMTSTITAKINPQICFYKLFKSIFPSGSVTGAPKIRSMQIINELEKEPRKVYTGAVGFFTPKKDAVFNVAIRTVLINKDGVAEMGVGSGIVADSKPEKEFDECKLKSVFVFKKLPKFRLLETMLYCPNLEEINLNFDGIKLFVSKKNLQNNILLLDYHLNRAKQSALYFDFKFDKEYILSKLNKKIENIDKTKFYRIRLLLSKNGEVELQCIPLINYEFCSKKIEKVFVSQDSFVDNKNVFLYHKTTLRRKLDMLWQKYKNKGYFDVILVNKNNEVTETTRCNIFIKINNQWVTPNINCGLLPGVMRKYVLEQNSFVIQRPISLYELYASDKILLSNSVIGLKEVIIGI